ncbi:hypothetical protein KAW08_05495 [bacterium]|nr:hypothetical protein [bacterium]
MINPINLETHRHYVTEVVKLRLWYVKWLLNFGVKFECAIQRHVRIYQITSFYDENKTYGHGMSWKEPRWKKLLTRLRKIYDKYPGHPTLESTAKLEEEGLTILWPYLEKHIQTEAKTVPKKRPYGCFSYNDREGYLALHFANDAMPKSPFHDISALANSLYRLLIDSKRRCPETLKVRMTSWLNAFPPFLTLFPDIWGNSRKPMGPDSGDGAWGQFIDRRGDFHSRNGAVLRETGQFPYVYSLCECNINQLVKYLVKEKIGG